MSGQRIQIVCYIRGWIVEALARQWEVLLANGLPRARVRLVLGPPEPGDDIYIHFVYLTAQPVAGARNIVYVTHVDRWAKALRLIELSRLGAEMIVLSRETREVASRYLGVDRARCIAPRSIHFNDRRQTAAPLTFGLFFKLYPDGRKSPETIRRLLRLANARPELCRLVLMGSGWKAVAGDFPSLAAFVCEDSFDRHLYELSLLRCDYVLYFGRDEGAMSIVDAGALGIPVLATSAGFHADTAHAKGSQLFRTGGEVVDAVERLCLAGEAHSTPTDPVSLFEGNGTQDCARASFWRYFGVPFVSNPALLRGGNASQAIAWLWQKISRQARPARAPACVPQSAPLAAGTSDASELHEQRGLQLAGSGLDKLAILDFERSIELRPENAHLHLNLALSRLRIGEYEGAKACFERGLSLGGDPAAFHCRFGAALSAAGRAHEARRHFDIALQMSLGPVARQ